MMDKELTREKEKDRDWPAAIDILKSLPSKKYYGVMNDLEIPNVDIEHLAKALSETYTRAQSDLAKKILGMVPEMPMIVGTRTCLTHEDFKCENCTSHNDARRAILTVLQDNGVDVTDGT